MWRDYFQKATIVGIDVSNDSKQSEDDRIKIEIGDQGNTDFLKQIGDKYTSFDIILDDGSHDEHHQILGFQVLGKYLKRGGIYVIEDMIHATVRQFIADMVGDITFDHMRKEENQNIEMVAVYRGTALIKMRT